MRLRLLTRWVKGSPTAMLRQMRTRWHWDLEMHLGSQTLTQIQMRSDSHWG